MTIQYSTTIDHSGVVQVVCRQLGFFDCQSRLCIYAQKVSPCPTLAMVSIITYDVGEVADHSQDLAVECSESSHWDWWRSERLGPGQFFFFFFFFFFCVCVCVCVCVCNVFVCVCSVSMCVQCVCMCVQCLYVCAMFVCVCDVFVCVCMCVQCVCIVCNVFDDDRSCMFGGRSV